MRQGRSKGRSGSNLRWHGQPAFAVALSCGSQDDWTARCSRGASRRPAMDYLRMRSYQYSTCCQRRHHRRREAFSTGWWRKATRVSRSPAVRSEQRRGAVSIERRLELGLQVETLWNEKLKHWHYLLDMVWFHWPETLQWKMLFSRPCGATATGTCYACHARCTGRCLILHYCVSELKGAERLVQP